MSKCAKVRNLLQTPSTVREVGALLKLNTRQARLGVWMLTHTGQAESCGQVPYDEYKRGRKTLTLYRLTRRGYYMLRQDRRVRISNG